MKETIGNYLINTAIIALCCVVLSIVLRFLGFKPDPLKEQVREETVLRNAYYSRKEKEQTWAIHQPSNLRNGIHKILGATAFLCIWYILITGLIYLFDK